MPRNDGVRPVALAVAAGAVAGGVYTASPTTVGFLLVLPAIFAWAGRDLPSHERRWVRGLLTVAIVARAIAVAGLFLTADRFHHSFAVLIGDERFTLERSQWLVHLARGFRIDAIDFRDAFGEYGRSGVQEALAYWQLWFGLAPYGAHLINVLIWVSGAIVLHRMTRQAFGPLAALPGFAIVLFLPTLFIWSISALKEPAYFLLTALALAGAMTFLRASRAAQRATGFALCLASVAAIATLRSIALFVAAGGLLLGAAVWAATRRVRIATAVVLVILAGVGLRRQATQDLAMTAMRRAAITHLGHVRSGGYSYWLLDPRFYTRAPGMDEREYRLLYMLPAEAGRFALRAAVSFFAIPLPWQAQSRSALILLPQQVAWYGLAALAAIGMVAGWRRDAILTSFLVANVVLGAAVVSLPNGNVGTLVRLRDSVVTLVVWLSALGGCAALDWAARHFSEGVDASS